MPVAKLLEPSNEILMAGSLKHDWCMEKGSASVKDWQCLAATLVSGRHMSGKQFPGWVLVIEEMYGIHYNGELIYKLG
jgi:hypothetical protein